ncbi:MAG TPA: hypothetical protein VIJ27_01645 [Mucilaginibacter sp.]
MNRHLHTNKKRVRSSIAWQSILTVTIIAFLLAPGNAFAQKLQAASPDTAKTAAKPSYPKVVGYLSFILPLVSVSNTTTYDFSKGTSSIGFPIGINVLYSDRFGFSYEFTPTIKASGGTSKMSNLLFDPGPMFRFECGFTFISRLAFETSGRYGFTPVFNQVYLRTKDVNYFVAMSLPTRFGNSAAASIGLNLQIGFTFN